MKTKIGEKTNKPKSGQSWAARYPGAIILAVVLAVGGIGLGVTSYMRSSGEQDEIVAENTVEQQDTENKEDIPVKAPAADKENTEDQTTEDKTADSNKTDDAEKKEDVPVLDASEQMDPAEQMNVPVMEDMITKIPEAGVTMNAIKDSVEIREQVGGSTDPTAPADPSAPAPEAGEESTTDPVPETPKAPSETASTASLSGKAQNHKKTVNGDTVGWLSIPNTNINYPVVQYSDNSYYVYKNYYKQYDQNGVIYADCDDQLNGRLSKNNIIYGHNWSNVYSRKVADPSDIMFGQLPSFHTLSFAQKTPFIYFSTLDKDYVWQVFSVFYVEESFNYITADPSSSHFKTIISEALKRSLHDYHVNVTTSDQILTLSTCTRVYGQRSDQRFVVMAKRVKPGTPATSITANPNPKQPQF